MRSKSGLKLACNDESPPFGWYFPPNVEAGFADLDLPEALSLRMAEETLRSLLPPAFLEALESTLPQGPQTLGIQSGECAGALAHESGTCGTYAGSAPAAYRRGDSAHACTYRLYRRGLAALCREHGIALQHHDALSDARACTHLFLLASGRTDQTGK